jgi:glycosyltransferase involved in cell wall biosynthesis
MSVYNGEAFVDQAVDSILAQTYDDFEFIIVDDGSSDGTRSILNGYVDPRIVRVHNERNIGLTRSLNKALASAKGRYIARQDADDISMPGRLAKQVAYFDTHPSVGLLGTAVLCISEATRSSETWQPMTDNADLQKALMGASRFFHGAVMFRRICAKDTGGWYREDLRFAQDYDLWLRIAEAWDLANLPQVLYCYREHEGMVSAHHGDEQDKCVQIGRSSAIERRRAAGWNWVLGRREQSPRWMRAAGRPRIAQRYLWWSAGVPGPQRFRYALEYSLIALCAAPTYGPAWRYLVRVAGRKTRSLSPDWSLQL